VTLTAGETISIHRQIQERLSTNRGGNMYLEFSKRINGRRQTTSQNFKLFRFWLSRFFSGWQFKRISF